MLNEIFDQADECPIDIEQIIDFFSRTTIGVGEIRDSVQSLSWKDQMQRVLDSIFIIE